MNDMPRLDLRISPDTRVNAAGWLLALAYGIGGPAFAVAEYLAGVTSSRFGYPSALVYFVCASQFFGALALFVPAVRLLGITGLTVISVGAVASHLMIGSPLTALPALAFTVAQLWLGYRIVEDRGAGS